VGQTTTGAETERGSRGEDSNCQAPAVPDQTSTRPVLDNGPANPVRPADIERNKKRKALQNEFDAIELQQKKMRIAQQLADLDNED
jgi:hypothetical protein